jgi:ribose 5-phosphate isomerase
VKCIDAAFNVIEDPYELDVLLNITPGIVAHGLFIDLIEKMMIARSDYIEELVQN